MKEDKCPSFSTYFSFDFSYPSRTKREYSSLDILEKLAEIFRVPMVELFDDYHLFLYKGQGVTIKKY